MKSSIFFHFAMVVTINNETVVEGNTAKIRLELNDTLSDDCNITVQTMDETAVGERLLGIA